MPDASDPKFLADENVGKLGRWLRILGYDVAYQSPALDAQLALKALRENRVILTRDREFVERRMVERYLLLTSQDPIEQLKQVIQTFDLKLDRNSRSLPVASIAIRLLSPFPRRRCNRLYRSTSIAHRISFIGVRPVTSSFGRAAIRPIFRIG